MAEPDAAAVEEETGSGRPSLLFLCQNLPFPPDAGALIRSFHTLRLLSGRFDVTALCFHRRALRPGSDEVRESVEALGRHAVRVEAFPIPQDSSRVRFVADHARSVLGGRAYTRWVYESARFRRRLRWHLTHGDFDLVHLDSLDLVGYLPLLGGLPVGCAHHNVESSLLLRRAEMEGGWRRAYLRHQARLVEREERRWCPRMRVNLVVSEADKALLRTRAPEAECVVVPNGVDTAVMRPADEAGTGGIVFVGGYTWFPNRDGMDHFARSILPGIRERHPEVEATWVGRAPDEIRRRFEDLGIRMTGYVEDIRPWVHAASCFVVPLRVGGGTRLKILDAWALGKAVVSTRVGAEGLEVHPGRNILLEDDPPAFADAVCTVLEDEALRHRLEREGRRTAVTTYDWDSVGRPMLETYEAIVDAG